MYSTRHRAVNTHRIRGRSYHSYLLLVLLWVKNKKRTQDSTTDGKSKESAKKKKGTTERQSSRTLCQKPQKVKCEGWVFREVKKKGKDSEKKIT